MTNDEAELMRDLALRLADAHPRDAEATRLLTGVERLKLIQTCPRCGDYCAYTVEGLCLTCRVSVARKLAREYCVEVNPPDPYAGWSDDDMHALTDAELDAREEKEERTWTKSL